MKADRIPLIFFLLMVGLLLCVASPVWADECRGHSCNDSDGTVNVDSSVSNSVRDTSRALGFGAGDVDIAQCYRSWSVIVYQDSKPNLLCVADSLDAKGLYEAAARTRCSVRAYSRIFDTQDECIRLSTVEAYVEPVAMPEPVDDDEEYHEEQQIYRSSVEERLAKIESDRRASVRRAAQQKREEQQMAQKVLEAYQETEQ